MFMGYVSHAMSRTPWLQKRDIDNPDQRISDSAEQQLACRKTGLVWISALHCHSKCQAVPLQVLPEVFQHDVHPFLRIPICCAPYLNLEILELWLMFVDARWCQHDQRGFHERAKVWNGRLGRRSCLKSWHILMERERVNRQPNQSSADSIEYII